MDAEPKQIKSADEALVGIGPEDILPIIPGVIDDLTDRRATCAINNNTQRVLRLDTASLDDSDDDSGRTPGIRHGEYVTFPPSQVAPMDQSGRFAAKNSKVLVFSTTGVGGEVKYELVGDPRKTQLFTSNPVADGTKNPNRRDRGRKRSHTEQGSSLA
ncbi:MAG: hypothetical protein IPP87_03640 [Ideonella sp.]|nr:hypothetical protein [Ideonella sp.]